jgi:fusion protein PurCD
LIDEIHTPDSSRFWRAADYARNPENAEQIDKEYVRQWLLYNKVNGQFSSTLPEDVVQETSRRYLDIYTLVTGQHLEIAANEPIKARICRNLVSAGLLKDAYIAIIMGSPADREFCQKIQDYLEKYNLMTEFRVVSAHKNGEELVKMVPEYNDSIEPGAVIAVAGRSNGLGGALAANLNIPVISCPPFKDNLDLLTNINSSLMMPSQTPAMTVAAPDNAAYAALRSLNLYRLRNAFSEEIALIKAGLRDVDKEMRGRRK